MAATQQKIEAIKRRQDHKFFNNFRSHAGQPFDASISKVY